MNCRQIAPYLAASTDELQAATAAAVGEHIATCRLCRAESVRFAGVRMALASSAGREPEPPESLVPAVLAATTGRRTMPMLPVLPIDVVRTISENRELIAQTAGVALVAAGAAWALWRGVKAGQRAQAART